MSRRVTAVLLLALTAATGLTGCSSDDEEPSATGPDADCLDASAVAPRIVKNSTAGEITVNDAQAVQSESSDVYYVALDLTAAGEDTTGVWVTTALETDEALSVLAVDNVAKQITGWPDAAKAYDITYPNDSTDAAEACLDS